MLRNTEEVKKMRVDLHVHTNISDSSLSTEGTILLAKSLGVGRSSLYRSLESLEKNGNIERQESNIRVIKL